MPLRNSDISYYLDSQMTRFTSEQIPICPNDCGEMSMLALPIAVPQLGEPHPRLVPEAFAQCGKCRHQMVVADGRPQRS